MKKIIASMTVLILLAVCTLNVGAEGIFFDSTKANHGVVGITYYGEDDIRYKVMIDKGSERYTYDYFGSGKAYFPLQSGSGTYKVSILENISGTKYKVIQSKAIKMAPASENVVFLQSVQNVNWSLEMGMATKAEELTSGLTVTEDKVEAIYHYIVTNVSYDYKKPGNLNNQYVPDVEDTFTTKKGICYDYSALFASMLRSQGIPAKLVKGYSDNVDGYHAWNEVFIDGEWITIDTTYDAIMLDFEEDTELEKDKNEYQIARIY